MSFDGLGHFGKTRTLRKGKLFNNLSGKVIQHEVTAEKTLLNVNIFFKPEAGWFDFVHLL